MLYWNYRAIIFLMLLKPLSHEILFSRLLDKNFPVHLIWLDPYVIVQEPVHAYLVGWIFHVSNGIWQGGVLSSFLFTMLMTSYCQNINSWFEQAQVGCYWDSLFAGSDDLVLLATALISTQCDVMMVASMIQHIAICPIRSAELWRKYEIMKAY